jgi:hypothetical protein
MKQISKEELNWLYYGDLTNQILAKLENNISPFEEFINHMSMFNDSIYMNLQQILFYIQDDISIEFTDINDEQLKRLYKLNKKYGMVEL